MILLLLGVRNGRRKRNASDGWLERYVQNSERECEHDEELPSKGHLECHEGDGGQEKYHDFGYYVEYRGDFQAKDLEIALVHGFVCQPNSEKTKDKSSRAGEHATVP
jgi:hypothetical protein